MFTPWKNSILILSWMPWTSIEMDEHGQNQGATGVIMQVQNGEYVTVYPEEWATAEPIFPAPTWSER